MLCNGRFTDPWGVTRNLLLMWHPVQGKQFWSVASQNLELTHIGSYEQDSIILPYGTDGTDLYQLFMQPDPALKKRLSTKSLRGNAQSLLTVKNFKRLYLELHDHYGSGVEVTGTVTAGGGGVPGGVQDVGFNLAAGKKTVIDGQNIEGGGIWAHVDLESLSPDFTIERLHVAGEQRTLWGA
jgi:hypothetical protein